MNKYKAILLIISILTLENYSELIMKYNTDQLE